MKIERSIPAIILAVLTLSVSASSAEPQPATFYTTVALSPDGRRIAYSAEVGEGLGELYRVDVDGSHRLRLTDTGGEETYPTWAPDGRRVMFARSDARGKASAIFVRTMDGAGLARITRGEHSDLTPDWSRDGRKVAFSRVTDGREAIVTSRSDGSDARVVVAMPGLRLFDPVWSPDARRLVFFSEAGDHKDQVWIVDADGAHLKRITDGEGHNIFPIWSPDGRKVLFTSKRDMSSPGPAGVLVVMSPDGSDPRPIPGTAGAFKSSWNPKTGRIAYVHFTQSPSGFSSEIVMIDPDGGRRVAIRP